MPVWPSVQQVEEILCRLQVCCTQTAKFEAASAVPSCSAPCVHVRLFVRALALHARVWMLGMRTCLLLLLLPPPPMHDLNMHMSGLASYHLAVQGTSQRGRNMFHVGS